MKRKPHPATILASLALFFSLGGTGLAASHYLITSVRQIAPSVRRELRGQRGIRGLVGPQGVTGEAGPQGVAGQTGPAGAAGIPGVAGAAGLGAGPLTAADTYLVSESTALTPSVPSTDLSPTCHGGDFALTGGFSVYGATVSESAPFAVAPDNTTDRWFIRATLDQNASSGQVEAWVRCVSSS